MEKLYCYVDETGQHTGGALFVVAVVVAKADRDGLEASLLRVEAETGKGATKWMKTRRDVRSAYLRAVFADPGFCNRLFTAESRGTRDYKPLTLVAVAAAINATRHAGAYKASVFIDGLKRAEERAVSTSLHRMGVSTEKVRGVVDQSSAFIRLADAVAGVTREAAEGRLDAVVLAALGARTGALRRV